MVTEIWGSKVFPLAPPTGQTGSGRGQLTLWVDSVCRGLRLVWVWRQQDRINYSQSVGTSSFIAPITTSGLCHWMPNLQRPVLSHNDSSIAICQMSSTVSSLRQHPWNPCIFLLPDWESGIHCLIICRIQLSTPNNLGRNWRCICLLDSSISALKVFTYLRFTNRHLLNYLLQEVKVHSNPKDLANHSSIAINWEQLSCCRLCINFH